MEKMPHMYTKLVNLLNNWEEKRISPKVFGKLLSDRFRLSKADIKPIIEELESLGIAIRKPKTISIGGNSNGEGYRSGTNTRNMQKMRNRRS